MKELLNEIFKATGKSLQNGDYGFIIGTNSPDLNTPTGLHSTSQRRGYEIWKIEDGHGESKTIIPKDYEDSKRQIIEFLNEKH